MFKRAGNDRASEFESLGLTFRTFEELRSSKGTMSDEEEHGELALIV